MRGENYLQVETHREGTLDIVSVVLEYQLHFPIAQGTVLSETSMYNSERLNTDCNVWRVVYTNLDELDDAVRDGRFAESLQVLYDIVCLRQTKR